MLSTGLNEIAILQARNDSIVLKRSAISQIGTHLTQLGSSAEKGILTYDFVHSSPRRILAAWLNASELSISVSSVSSLSRER